MRDLERLAAGLRGALANGAQVTGVSVLSAGHSNETYLVHGVDQILRMPPSGAALLPSARGVRAQFDLFAVLRGRPGAPPIPALTYVCDDPAVLGAPFFLMEKVEGLAWEDWEAPAWARDRDEVFRSGISRQAVDFLAGLHRMAPLDILGPVRDNAAELERWRASIAAVDRPDLHALFAAVGAKAPPLIEAAACHGDPKLPNMLWREGELAAVLDWEMAFNGDPRWDLAWMIAPFESPHWAGQPGLDLAGLWQRDEMIEAWRAATGRSLADFAWFEAAANLKVAAILAYGWHMVRTGLSTDPRFAAWDPAAAEFTRRARAVFEAGVG